jgi:NAD(P)H-dependent flavin oxidoreductase YrpB (nitropropane dioxygenase family)
MLPTCLSKKVESLGADALIAVNLAGGHEEILLLKH